MVSENNLFAGSKIFNYVDRITAFKENKNPAPINISLDLTYACGHRCPKCTGDPKWKLNSKKIELSDEKFRKIFKQLYDYGALSITFVGGGDTMTRPNCEKLITYADKLGLETGLLTNGQIMSKKQANTLIPVLKFLRISLDASNPKMFSKTHGMKDPAEFCKVLETIDTVVKTKKNTNSKCKIGVSYLTSELTIKGMTVATNIVKNIGVDYIQFKPFRENTTLIDKELIKCKKLETPTFKVLCSTPKYDLLKAHKGHRPNFCYAQQFSTQIDPNGNVTICCDHKGNPSMVIGNLNKQTFKQIWESTKRNKIINSINFNLCPKDCRGNQINTLLYEILTPKEHAVFL